MTINSPTTTNKTNTNPRTNTPTPTLLNTFIVNFPVYSLAYHPSSGTILVGGGGGPSRSGVKNGLIILKLHKAPHLNNNFVIEKGGELLTGDEAVMSLSLYDDKTDCLVVAGVNDRCWLLEYHPSDTTNILNLLRTVQSDTSPDSDGYLRVTRFTPNGRSVLAAGSDGILREWGVPEMRIISTIVEHSSATDDENENKNKDINTATAALEILDVDSDASTTAVVTTNGRINLHPQNRDNDKKNIFIQPSKGFSYKFVRIHNSSSSAAAAVLYAVENCSDSKLKRRNPKLVKLSLTTGKRLNSSSASSVELLFSKNCTAFLVTDTFLAFGFADGSLLVLNSSNPRGIHLQRRSAHSFPVTGLAIDETLNVLISSSADGVILISKLSLTPTTPTSITLTILLIFTAIAFLLLAFLWKLPSTQKYVVDEAADFDAFYAALGEFVVQ